MQPIYKVGEFCAGTGAFSLGFETTLRTKTIYANDIDHSAKVIFDNNHQVKMTLEDLHQLKISDIPQMDILTNGFPCQPFSIAGQRKGFKDDRSNVL
jgi:DNA (cytosine-5)-methyltransferase 1